MSLATGSVFNVGDLHKGAQTICLDIVGVRSLAVYAKDDSAAALYRHFGFEPSATDSRHLFMLIKDIRPAAGD